MNNDFRSNRLEPEIAEWNSKEERLKKLFKSTASLENSLLKEKLKFYESILLKYKNTGHLDERTVLQIIKSERNNLIKKVYSSLFQQYFYLVMKLLIWKRISAKNQVREELKNNQSLSDNLKRTGFKDLYNRVERHMKLGHNKFTVPISYYLNEKEQINHSLDFIKNEQGYYDFNGFKSNLRNHNNGENRDYYFNIDEVKIFNAEQAYELLSGRAVLTAGTWKQFDLNQKEDNGNYRLKEFPEVYGYSIEKNVSELSLKISNQLEMKLLIDSLKDGRREEATLTKEGSEKKVFIEANPQNKCLNIYNENLRKVSVESLFKVKREAAVKLQPSLKKQECQVKSKCRKI